MVSRGQEPRAVNLHRLGVQLHDPERGNSGICTAPGVPAPSCKSRDVCLAEGSQAEGLSGGRDTGLFQVPGWVREMVLPNQAQLGVEEDSSPGAGCSPWPV